MDEQKEITVSIKTNQMKNKNIKRKGGKQYRVQIYVGGKRY